MSFYDLPSDWPMRPLSDPRIVADVLDLVVSDADRRSGAVCVLLCREDDRLAQPVLIAEVEARRFEHTREELLVPFVEVVEQTDPGGSLVVAVVRRYGLRPTDEDRAWHQAAIDACQDRVRLLSVHVVTLDGVERLPDEPRALGVAS